MPSKVTAEEAPPRLLVGLYYLLLPALKPILKRTLRRIPWVWRRLQAARDRLLQASPLPVGLEAPWGRRMYAGAFYVFGPPLRWLLKYTVGRNAWAWGQLKALHHRLTHGSRRPGGLAGPSATASHHTDGRPGPFGVNVAGYLDSQTGTGEVARTAVRLLRDANIACVLNNVIGPSTPPRSAASAEFSHDNPYPLNLICVNPDQAATFAWDKGEAYFHDRYNIGVWNWEMTDLPPEWLPRFRYYSEIWAPTSFVANALSRVSPVPVLRMPYAINPEPVRADGFDRSGLGLSSDTFFFLFVFDFHSILERKNPLGLIQAFKRAFSRQEDAVLVIKSSNADRQAVRMMREAAVPANVRVVDTVLSRERLHALYQLCDCYVSLHRSEGFGLTPAEAMCVGKPVIATAYGGNTDFMTPQNSYPVSYSLRELDKDYGPYKKGWAWADPDLDHAAELMHRVYERPTEARAIGRRARKDVLRLLHPGVVGNLMKQRLLTIAALQGMTGPDPETAAEPAATLAAKGAP